MTVLKTLVAAASAACILVAGLPAMAADFAGKTIEIVIPASEGGGTDIWARILAPMLRDELPGNPVIVIRNVPGGASLNGGNYFQQNAQPNGEMAFALAGSTIMGYLFRDSRVQFDIANWVPVMASPMGTVVYASPSLLNSAQDIAQLKGQRLVYGSREATGTDLPMLLAFDMLGLDIVPVFGVQGRGDGRLGFERGEFNIDRQTTIAYQQSVQPMVDDGRAVPLFSFGVFDAEGNLLRDPNFPDIMHFGEVYELVHGTAPSGPAWEAWKTFNAAGYGVSKALVLPEGTPDDIVQAYHDAIAAIMNNPARVEELRAEIGDYQQGIGSDAGAFVNQAASISEESDAWIRQWLTEKYDVRF